MSKPKILVTETPIRTDSPVCKWVGPGYNLYHINVENENGVWEEVYVTESERDAFIRGVNAGASMFGAYLDPPAVIRHD